MLTKIGKDPAHKHDWLKIHGVLGAIGSYEFVFNAHLMLEVLSYTDELSQSLQKRDQDIINAMSLVGMAKRRLQKLREDGWEGFQAMVNSFCKKHIIKVPMPDARYVPYARSPRCYPKQTIADHYRREVFIGFIDSIRQELDNRFDEINMELLICMSALNPVDAFAAYDRNKVLKLAEFYPNDFSQADLMRLGFQLDNFIDDMRQDDRFTDLQNLGQLSMKLVETKKSELYKLVYLLLKLVLLLPVATASVERVFSAMNIVKTNLRTTMGDQLLNDCLVTYIEREIFKKVTDDDIIKLFMAAKTRRVV